MTLTIITIVSHNSFHNSEIKKMWCSERYLHNRTSGVSIWSCECRKSIRKSLYLLRERWLFMFGTCKQKLKLNGASETFHSCQPTNNAPSTLWTIQFSLDVRKKVSISDAPSPSLIPIKFIGMTVNEVLFSLHSHSKHDHRKNEDSKIIESHPTSSWKEKPFSL